MVLYQPAVGLLRPSSDRHYNTPGNRCHPQPGKGKPANLTLGRDLRYNLFPSGQIAGNLIGKNKFVPTP